MATGLKRDSATDIIKQFETSSVRFKLINTSPSAGRFLLWASS